MKNVFRRRPNPASAAAVDLTEDWRVLLTLLRRPEAWRIRSVEALHLGSAQLCVRRKTLHVGPLDRLLRLPDGVDRVRVLLPLQWMTKRPLLGFDVRVDDRPAYLLPREVTAGLEAEYVVELAKQEGVEIDPRTQSLIEAICAFTPAIWLRVRGRSRSHEGSLRRYLQEGLGDVLSDQAGSAAVGDEPHDRRGTLLDTIVAQSAAVGRHVAGAAGVPGSGLSSAEEPALALPAFVARTRVMEATELVVALVGLRRVVERLASQPGSVALQTFADAGLRWLAIVDCEVPTSRPFLVRMQHESPLRIGWWSRTAVQRVAIGDARSNHVTVGTTDTDVELAAVQLRAADGHRLERTIVAGVRQSRDRFAAYLAEPGREVRGELRIRLEVPLSVQAASITVAAVSVLALMSLVALLSGRPEAVTGASLAVFTLPSTFAAALLLTRERTSLARRLQWFGRTVTAGATLAIWVLVTTAWVLGWVRI